MAFDFGPLFHAIGDTARNVQRTAAQYHHDMETINEMNRQYAAERHGTAAHWDDYDENGNRTNGRNNSSSNRSRRRNSISRAERERQQQRDRSFERQHPYMARGLFMLMPHIGSYETGRGLTWNANGERWGDSIRRGADLIHNFQEQRDRARVWESMGYDDGQNAGTYRYHGNGNGNDDYRAVRRDDSDEWRRYVERPNIFDRAADWIDERNRQAAEERENIARRQHEAEQQLAEKQKRLREITEEHNRQFVLEQEEAQRRVIEEARKDAERIAKLSNDIKCIKRTDASSIKKTPPELIINSIDSNTHQSNIDKSPVADRESPLPDAEKRAAQDQYRAFCHLTRPLMNDSRFDIETRRQIQQTFENARDSYHQYLYNGDKNGWNQFKSYINDAYMITDGNNNDIARIPERMQLWATIRPELAQKKSETFRSDNKSSLQYQFREFLHTAKPLVAKDGLVSVNKAEMSKLIEDTHASVHEYMIKDNPTERDYAILETVLRHAQLAANMYNDQAKANIARYQKYRDNVTALNDTYGTSIPTYPFNYVDSVEKLRIQQLLEDAQAGKSISYQRRTDIDEMIKEDNEITVTQTFNDMKSVSNFVQSEAKLAPEEEIVAHDINISQTPDGTYNVKSSFDSVIVLDKQQEEGIKTASDVMQSRYPGDDVKISLGDQGEMTMDQLNQNTIVTDNGVVPNMDDAMKTAIDMIDVDKLQEYYDEAEYVPTGFTPDFATRAAAPSAATRSNAEKIEKLIRAHMNSSEETVWVVAHYRGGTYVHNYPRSRPHRS